MFNYVCVSVSVYCCLNAGSAACTRRPPSHRALSAGSTPARTGSPARGLFLARNQRSGHALDLVSCTHLLAMALRVSLAEVALTGLVASQAVFRGGAALRL